jgi:formylglycine-generating enzyme required for sulfatase activity
MQAVINRAYTFIFAATISLGVVSNANADDIAPFAPTITNIAKAPVHTPKGMVWIKGGEFSMGSADPTNTNVTYKGANRFFAQISIACATWLVHAAKANRTALETTSVFAV